MTGQNFNNLLQLAKLTGGKYVLVEDGKPRMVLMSYQEFEELVIPLAERRILDQASKIEEVNRQIMGAQLLDLREEVIQPLDILDSLHRSKTDADEIRVEPLGG